MIFIISQTVTKISVVVEKVCVVFEQAAGVIYLSRQYSKFEHYDVFGIRYQVRLICWVGSIVLLAFIVASSVRFQYVGVDGSIVMLIPYSTFFIACVSIMYIEVPWSIKHMKKSGFLNPNHDSKSNYKNSNINTKISIGSSSPVPVDLSKDKNHWFEVVSTVAGYQSFINYLETEFSIENLLFITEVSAK